MQHQWSLQQLGSLETEPLSSPILYSNDVQLPAQLMSRTIYKALRIQSPPLSKQAKGGGISLWLIKNNATLQSRNSYIDVANSMQSYHRTLLICASVLPIYIRCDLYLPACVRTKAQTIVITWKKNVLQKGPETEKKNFGLWWDWTHSWGD